MQYVCLTKLPGLPGPPTALLLSHSFHPRLTPGICLSVLFVSLMLALFAASFVVGFGLAFAPRPSVFAEAPSGCPGVCARRVPLPFFPFVFAFWWLRLVPRGCSVFAG